MATAGDLNVTGLFALNKVVFFRTKTVHYLTLNMSLQKPVLTDRFGNNQLAEEPHGLLLL
jgi:hypothetical protein